jgi:threonine/homoserine/homoserine lactone efflux protein
MTSIDVGFKTTGYFFAFLPQFVDGDRTGDVALTMLAQGPHFVTTAITMVGYALTATLVRRYVVGQPAVMTWLRRAVAGLLVLPGVRLALAQR